VVWSTLFHISLVVLLISLPVFRKKILIVEEIIPVNIITPPAETAPPPVRKKPVAKKQPAKPRKPAPPPKAPKAPKPPPAEKLPELMPTMAPPPVPEISLKERVQKRLEVKEPPTAPRAERKPPAVVRETPPDPAPPPEAEPVREALVLKAADFTHAWYIAVIKSKIFQIWSPPGRLVTARQGMGAYVKFRVERNGRISSIALDKSSGYTLLDRSALEAVGNVQDLPPLPADYQEEYLNVVVFFQQLDG